MAPEDTKTLLPLHHEGDGAFTFYARKCFGEIHMLAKAQVMSTSDYCMGLHGRI